MHRGNQAIESIHVMTQPVAHKLDDSPLHIIRRKIDQDKAAQQFERTLLGTFVGCPLDEFQPYDARFTKLTLRRQPRFCRRIAAQYIDQYGTIQHSGYH